MNLYEACVVLGVWHAAKARAQLWSISTVDHTIALDALKLEAKSKFKELAMIHHPDKGGGNDQYLNIQDAHETIKSASISEFIHALSLEKTANAQYCNPGSAECKSCSKWCYLADMCATTSCTGFNKHEEPVFSKFSVRRKTQGVQNSGFFSRRGQELGQKAG